jgi:mucin-2
MPEEREDVETKSSDSPEVYKQTKLMAWFEKDFPWLLVSGATLGLTVKVSGDLDTTGS